MPFAPSFPSVREPLAPTALRTAVTTFTVRLSLNSDYLPKILRPLVRARRLLGTFHWLVHCIKPRLPISLTWLGEPVDMVKRHFPTYDLWMCVKHPTEIICLWFLTTRPRAHNNDNNDNDNDNDINEFRSSVVIMSSISKIEPRIEIRWNVFYKTVENKFNYS